MKTVRSGAHVHVQVSRSQFIYVNDRSPTRRNQINISGPILHTRAVDGLLRKIFTLSKKT